MTYLFRTYTFWISMLLLTITTIVTADTIAMGEIKFKTGESSATLDNGLARGEIHEYLLKAAAGQTMHVSITSVENNAVFALYQRLAKGKRLALTNDDESEVVEATGWSGELPGKGKGAQTFVIEVGAIRGGADYVLVVGID